MRISDWSSDVCSSDLAQDQAGDIADKIINNPNPQAFQVFNAPEPARVVADKTVQGGHALRVKIPGADAKAWTISLSDPIEKPVKKGDKLVLAFYARATKSKAADGGAHLPNNGVQLARDRKSTRLNSSH